MTSCPTGLKDFPLAAFTFHLEDPVQQFFSFALFRPLSWRREAQKLLCVQKVTPLLVEPLPPYLFLVCFTKVTFALFVCFTLDGSSAPGISGRAGASEAFV